MNQDILKSKIKLIAENLVKLETNLPESFENFRILSFCENVKLR